MLFLVLSEKEQNSTEPDVPACEQTGVSRNEDSRKCIIINIVMSLLCHAVIVQAKEVKGNR